MCGRNIGSKHKSQNWPGMSLAKTAVLWMAAAQEHILFFHYTENDEVTKYTQGTIHKTLFTDIIEFIKGAYFCPGIVQESFCIQLGGWEYSSSNILLVIVFSPRSNLNISFCECKTRTTKHQLEFSVIISILYVQKMLVWWCIESRTKWSHLSLRKDVPHL